MPTGTCPECDAEVHVDTDADKGDIMSWLTYIRALIPGGCSIAFYGSELKRLAL